MKSITCLAVILLVISSFAAIGIRNEADIATNMETMEFGIPTITQKTEYTQINVEGTNTFITTPGKPMLPVKSTTVTLPFGVEVENVICEVNNVKTMSLSQKIIPAPQRHILSTLTSEDVTLVGEKSYDFDSATVFPNNWFEYHVGVGLDENMEEKTFVVIRTYPIRYTSGIDEIEYAEKIDLSIKYYNTDYDPFPTNVEYDMVVIAPQEFENALQPLITHKNNLNPPVKTIFKSTEDIFSEYSKNDKPEEIKYFIDYAKQEWGITYVLLVGGLKSTLYAKSRDDPNQGSKGWHVPVRYSNLGIDVGGEPGYPCDLYYADLYKEGGEFDDWDSNDDGLYAEFRTFGGDKLDMYPDVALGRLACRNLDEVNAVVDKIINYETNTPDPSWFKRMVGVTGDGFLDQEKLGFQWNTNNLPNGDYTLYAQSNNDEGEFGPIEEINFEIDRTQFTKLTFNHDDHLRIPNYPSYPALPMAEIMTISDGDVLGYDDYEYVPSDGEAYLNYWTGYGNIKFQNGVLTIGGKSYDPKLYGNVTDIHVWIENSNEEIVFDQWRTGLDQMYSEGDWTMGEILKHGRAGAFYYMPQDFEKVFLSSSNGNWDEPEDIIDAVSQGCGFLLFQGHGQPNSWSNHFPGVPGNRRIGEAEGLRVSKISLKFPYFNQPLYPMEELTNNGKPPVAVVGGCHNSLFNVSGIPSILNYVFMALLGYNNWMHTFIYWTPECFSWYLVKMPQKGAIASIGNTGYGLGVGGEWATVAGVDNYITTEFFRQYGTEGQTILGGAHKETLKNYLDTFGKKDDGDVKTVQQWVLLGDPSLKMGGYSS